jgi:hypothetical protein
MRQWCVITGIYGISVLAAWIGYAALGDGTYYAMGAELHRISASEREIRAQLNLKRRRQADALQALSVVKSMRDRPDWSLLLSAIGTLQGNDIFLREVALAPDTGILPLSPGGYAFHLVGIGSSPQSASQFVLRLQDLGVLEKVRMVRTSAEAVGGRMGTRFELDCRLADIGGSK